MTELYSETFINIMETICEHCNARTEDCYIDCADSDNCVLQGWQTDELLNLCVRVDDLAHGLEKSADTAGRVHESYYDVYGIR